LECGTKPEKKRNSCTVLINIVTLHEIEDASLAQIRQIFTWLSTLISAIGCKASTTGFSILSPIFSKSLHVGRITVRKPTPAAIIGYGIECMKSALTMTEIVVDSK
jgi:hypothetical protein